MTKVLIFFFGLVSVCSAQGGPPLLTDDPGTVEKGKWEINISWIHRRSHGVIENELPHFDSSFGISQNAHVKFEVPWLSVTEDGSTISGDAGGSTGVKWRFIEGSGEHPSVSTYPQVGFQLSSRSVRLGLSGAATTLLLPIQIQWDFPRFSVNMDAGVELEAGADSGWIGGVAIGRKLPGVELLAEIHGEGIVRRRVSNWIGQLGFRKDVSELATIIIAFGRSIGGTRSEQLDWNSYVGIQLHF